VIYDLLFRAASDTPETFARTHKAMEEFLRAWGFID